MNPSEEMKKHWHGVHLPHMHRSSIHLNRPTHWVWFEKLSANKDLRNMIIAAIVVALVLAFLIWLAYISPAGGNYQDPFYYYG